MAEAPFDPRNCDASNCPDCNRIHAGQKECTGGRGCAVHQEYAAYARRASQDRSHEVLGRKGTFKRSLVKALASVLTLGMLAGCVTVPVERTSCSDTDSVTRFTDAQIDQMTDEQVRQELAKNEDLAKRGCAVPNK